jgi:hypothetical protein
MSTRPLPALIDRKQLAEELGITRAAVDAVFRSVPTVHLPGLRKPFVRRDDVHRLITDSTFHDDGTRVRA